YDVCTPTFEPITGALVRVTAADASTTTLTELPDGNYRVMSSYSPAYAATMMLGDQVVETAMWRGPALFTVAASRTATAIVITWQAPDVDATRHTLVHLYDGNGALITST